MFQGGRVMVSSRDVARVFEREHRTILQAVRELNCSPSFNEQNFLRVNYQDIKGETRPEILMTRDGSVISADVFPCPRSGTAKKGPNSHATGLYFPVILNYTRVRVWGIVARSRRVLGIIGQPNTMFY